MKKYGVLAPASAVTTLVASSLAAYLSHGIPWATVESAELLHFGAIDRETLGAHGIWRLFTSQLVHVKQAHMLFNVVLSWILGLSLERKLGSSRFFVTYWAGGTAGLPESVLFYPQYVSSGASQALVAVCAGLLVLSRHGLKSSRAVKILTLAVLAIQLALDIYVNRLPKAGHVVGFLAGGILSYGFLIRKASPETGNKRSQIEFRQSRGASATPSP